MTNQPFRNSTFTGFLCRTPCAAAVFNAVDTGQTGRKLPQVTHTPCSLDPGVMFMRPTQRQRRSAFWLALAACTVLTLPMTWADRSDGRILLKFRKGSSEERQQQITDVIGLKSFHDFGGPLDFLVHSVDYVLVGCRSYIKQDG